MAEFMNAKAETIHHDKRAGRHSHPAPPNPFALLPKKSVRKRWALLSAHCATEQRKTKDKSEGRRKLKPNE